MSTEGSVRERNSGISLKELVVWTNKVQFGVRAAKQEGSVMFGQLLSAKTRCSLAEQRREVILKEAIWPKVPSRWQASARREANAGSPVQRICQLRVIFACYQDFSEKDLRRAFFGRFEFQLARRPLPSAMEARRMTTLLPQDLQTASFNHVLKGGVPDAGTEGMRTVLKQTTKVYSWKSKKIHQPRKPPAFKAIDIPTTTWSSNLLGETVLCR